MAVAAISFQWMESLEKDFDVAFVDLDTLLGSGVLEQLDDTDSLSEEQPGMLTAAVRQKLGTLSSCWAQLTHKAQTVFQNNAKLEAALVQVRDELQEAQAARVVMEKEMKELLLQLHSSQLQLHQQTAASADSQNIIKKMDSDLYLRRRDLMREEKMLAELQQLRQETEQLNAYIVSLQSEVVGCRLAAKYMDKELAGRIQQIQLLGRGLSGPEHGRMWAQLESEIMLHRHKTLVRACRSRMWRDPPQEPKVSTPRVVHVTKADKEGLGMSITGGEEHGVPIVVSALKPDGPAQRSGLVHVGDTILSVNDNSLRQVRHQQAVEVLSSVTGDIKLELQYLPTLAEDLTEGTYDMEILRYDMTEGARSPSAAATLHQNGSARTGAGAAARTVPSRPGAAQKLAQMATPTPLPSAALTPLMEPVPTL